MRPAFFVVLFICLTGRAVAATVPTDGLLEDGIDKASPIVETASSLLLTPEESAPGKSAAEENAAEDKLGVLVIPMGVPSKQPGAGAEEQGYFDSLGIARVPLPAAAWLFGSAMLGIVAVSRRRPEKIFG